MTVLLLQYGFNEFSEWFLIVFCFLSGKTPDQRDWFHCIHISCLIIHKGVLHYTDSSLWEAAGCTVQEYYLRSLCAHFGTSGILTVKPSVISYTACSCNVCSCVWCCKILWLLSLTFFIFFPTVIIVYFSIYCFYYGMSKTVVKPGRGNSFKQQHTLTVLYESPSIILLIESNTGRSKTIAVCCMLSSANLSARKMWRLRGQLGSSTKRCRWYFPLPEMDIKLCLTPVTHISASLLVSFSPGKYISPYPLLYYVQNIWKLDYFIMHI